eukprot:403349568
MCYCCKIKCIRVSLLTTSLLLIVPAILLYIYGAFLKDSFNFLKNDGEKISQGAFGFVIALACLAILMALLGTMTAWCHKKKFCTCCHVLWGIIIGLIFLVLGIVFLIIGAGSQQIIDDFCAGKLDNRLTFITDAIKEVDETMRNTTADYYCRSDYCLCPSDTDFSRWNEKQLNLNYRTLKTTYVNVTDGKTYVQLQRAASTAVPSYDTFWKCYEYLKGFSASSSSVKSIDSNLKDLIETLESDFNCNGICSPGNFYFFRKVQEGPPNKNCINGIKDQFKEKPLAIGVILIVSFFLTTMSVFLVYGMCCCRKKND